MRQETLSNLRPSRRSLPCPRLQDVVDKVSFLMLGLDLPAAPLFKDALETVIIPQVRTGGG